MVDNLYTLCVDALCVNHWYRVRQVSKGLQALQENMDHLAKTETQAYQEILDKQ